MKKYKLEICRVSYAHNTINIEANSEEEAKTKALDEAGDHNYSEKNADYIIMAVSEETKE